MTDKTDKKKALVVTGGINVKDLKKILVSFPGFVTNIMQTRLFLKDLKGVKVFVPRDFPWYSYKLPCGQELSFYGHSFMSIWGQNALSMLSVRDQALILSGLVEKICKESGVEKVDFAGVSNGGLVGLYYLLNLDGAKRVNRFITLSSPLHGTWASFPAIVWAKSAIEVLPSSPVVKDLLSQPPPKNVKIFTLSGKRDVMVPWKRAQYEHAHKNFPPFLTGTHPNICFGTHPKVVPIIQDIVDGKYD